MRVGVSNFTEFWTLLQCQKTTWNLINSRSQEFSFVYLSRLACERKWVLVLRLCSFLASPFCQKYFIPVDVKNGGINIVIKRLIY